MTTISKNIKYLKNRTLRAAGLIVLILISGYACDQGLTTDDQSRLGSQVEISITPQIVCVQGVWHR